MIRRILFKADALTNDEISVKIDDMSGSVGRRYWRTDEMGIKYAITLDYDTLKTGTTVTLRERDSTSQIKIKVNL